jgi:hypothetical protein
MSRKFDEAANFVFVQLIEQEPGLYDKCHANYSRQDKIDLRDIGFSDFIHRSGIKKQTKEKHDVSETGSVSVLR